MSQITEFLDWLERELPRLLDAHSVPAASVGVYFEGETAVHAAGVLSARTRVEADTESVFQIGSITKVWTATLVMQLVDEGLLDLDDPVRVHLPEFSVADEGASARITVRQLLSHTAGFSGDDAVDTGRGDDAVQKLMPHLVSCRQLFSPGEMFSYNNAGYSVLGRIVEVLRGMPYNAALRQHLIVPLGLRDVAPTAYEAVLFRAAVGHLQIDLSVPPVPTPVWAMESSNAPAGTLLAMTARELLGFARLHVTGGLAPDGSRVLSAESVGAMQSRQVELPPLGFMGDAWGLGWAITDTENGPVIGHDGGTLGQNAFLRIVPGSDFAVCLLSNGGDPIALYRAIVAKAVEEFTGVVVPEFPVPAEERPRVHADRYLGTYSSEVTDTTVRQDDDGRLWMDRRMKGGFADLQTPDPIELVHHEGDTFIADEPLLGVYMLHSFLGDDGAGRAKYLHTGRADVRV
ncbi:serine hydrolase [Streptomyces sp. AC495_CC817]|uniref:serine hydrolase domain-containing protein n=1 Tax=Streptomyces sp. AC495_CC817 TaxID=2823900 RepID=UPI001C26CEF0|nr:serine hydrolase domain-containing protein [Streptomyces sp. AC495_CC817]